MFCLISLSACDMPMGASPSVLAPSTLTDGQKWKFSIEKTKDFLLDATRAHLTLYAEDGGVKTKIGTTEIDVRQTTGTIDGIYKNKKIQASCRTNSTGADTCTVYVDGTKATRLHV